MGQAAYRYLAQQVARILMQDYGTENGSNFRVDMCFLEHDSPLYAEVFSHEKTIFVPVFLSYGYHLQMDIHSQMIHPSSRISLPLGPDIAFFSDFFRRKYYSLQQNDISSDSDIPLILSVAGSSITNVQKEYAQLAEGLEQLIGREVAIWCANTQTYLLRDGRETSILLGNEDSNFNLLNCAYLLIPGHFYDQALTNCSRISPPLVHCTEIHRLVISRFIQELRRL